ncbi:hypothetical protein MAAFP003_3722 [Mycobacterium ahvazicum]|uniref:Uncharacterized protein n=1 Tax=Mycobacterium ahvazicum TaxID=1964395 RepID=A0A2K4YE27_9MYCO|nr:hypothetical protein MAAFP003_3722 [Mycobacterium ahvazicum]
MAVHGCVPRTIIGSDADCMGGLPVTGAEKGVARVNRYLRDSYRGSISGPEEPCRTFSTDPDRKT